MVSIYLMVVLWGERILCAVMTGVSYPSISHLQSRSCVVLPPNPLLCVVLVVVTGPGSSAPDGCWWHASRLRDLITPANSAPPDTAIGLVLEAAGAEMWNNGRLNIVLLIHNVHISHIHIRRIILNSIGDLRNWETIRRRRRILYNLQSIDIGQQWAQWALCPRCNNVHPPGVLCLARDTRYIGLSTALLTSIYYQP